MVLVQGHTLKTTAMEQTAHGTCEDLSIGTAEIMRQGD